MRKNLTINLKIFKNVWVQPAAGDAGGSLGAALAFWHLELKKERKTGGPKMLRPGLAGLGQQARKRKKYRTNYKYSKSMS